MIILHRPQDCVRGPDPAPGKLPVGTGAGFGFVARQKRIRIGNEWSRIDLLLFHRRLRCLVVIDLKIGRFTHADAGQMNLYLNYAKEHLAEPDENEPVGLILCSEKDDAVVHHAMGTGIAPLRAVPAALCVGPHWHIRCIYTSRLIPRLESEGSRCFARLSRE